MGRRGNPSTDGWEWPNRSSCTCVSIAVPLRSSSSTSASTTTLVGLGLVAKSKEVEVVRVFEDLRGQPGLGRREALVEVGEGSPLAQVELVFDLDGEGVAGPGVLESLAGIPIAERRLGELGDEGDDVEPRQLVSSLLTKLGSGLLPKMLYADQKIAGI